jgi:hypothetical protein
MKKELTVSLPPLGSLLREYVKTTFYYADYSNPSDEIIPTAEGFTIKSDNIMDSLSESIHSAAQTVEDNLRTKSAKFEFPFHSNDRRWRTIDKAREFLSIKGTSISELFRGYAEYLTAKCSYDELQRSLQTYQNGYPEDARITKRLAALSVFKPEHYQYVRSLGRSREFNLNLGVHTALIGMAGFILSKIGRVPVGKNSYLTVLITPEDISKKIKALQLRKPLEAIRSLREKSIPGLDPAEAFVLWLGLAYSNSETNLINVFIINEPFGQIPSSLHHEYTFNLKTVMSIAEKISDAGERSLKSYEYLLREALKYNAKERAFATNVVKKIFQVINGSAKPEELTYLASREALIGSKSSKVSPIRRIAPIVALTIQHNISSDMRL